MPHRQHGRLINGSGRIIGEIITELTFGACVDNEGNDYVAKHETLLDYSKKATAGYVVDFFPIRMSMLYEMLSNRC